MKLSSRHISKTAFLSGCFILILSAAKAQTAYEYLNQTNIKALFNADGQLFWDGKKANFEAPAGSGKNTISSAGVWIGGYDSLGTLHEAAQTYRESGSDFWPGPLKLSTGKTDTATSNQFNKVWKVTKAQIDSFRAGLATPSAILNWPGNGNTAKGYASKLAPFVDLNGNGIYEPANGEYPDILGDVMLWWVYNDAVPYHNKTQAIPMSVEIQASAYTYNCPGNPMLSNTIFIKYKVINRSSQTYSKTFLAQFADLDIGNIFDDYIGCDSVSNTFYGYNSTNFDKDTIINGKGFTYNYKGYGAMLPAQSVTFLKGINGDNGAEMPMSKFIYYNNEDNTPQGNPKTKDEFYNLLSGHWLNGTSLTTGGNGYGGNTRANFAFPGLPGDHKTWNEPGQGDIAGDRRGLGIFGPFTFKPGDSKEYTVAFGFHMSASGKTIESLGLMRDDVTQLSQQFRKNALVACTGLPTCIVGDSCVWPGDASNDGKSHFDDLFRLGYAYGATGPARTLASVDWKPQAAKAWGRSFPDGENFKYSDCNGDGKIDSMDVIAIDMNYSKTHAKSGGTVTSGAGDPLMKIVLDKDTIVSGDILSGKIYLGDSLTPIPDAYGAGLTLVFDPTLLDDNSFQFDLRNSDLGTLYELMALYKKNAASGGIDIAATRNTTTGKKVRKIFIDFKLVVSDDLAGYHTSEMKIENGMVLDSKLNPISINTQNATFTVVQRTGIKYKDLSEYISLYPNPANNQVIVDLTRFTGAVIRISNMQGQEMKTIKTTDQRINEIDIADLPAGMYLVDISTPTGHAMKKFSKIR
jgi:hypothetical protein